MKIKCSACGKRFDYDKYAGLCPKCGSFHISAATSHDMRTDVTTNHSTSVSSDIHEEQPPAYENPVSHKQPKKKSTAYHTVTILLVLLMILCAIVPISIVLISGHIKYKNNAETEWKEPSQIFMNEPFSYTTEEYQYQITITDAFIDHTPGIVLPADYELLAVTYKVTLPNDADPYYFEDDNNYLPGYIELTPYLLSSEMTYLNAASAYAVEDAFEYTFETSQAIGISDSFEYQHGTIYFLVKEKDNVSLFINNAKRNPVGNISKDVLGSYLLEDLEVDR